MRASPGSLRRQLLRWLLGPLLMLWLIGTVFAYFVTRSFSDVAYDRALFGTARAVAAQITVAQGGVTVDLPPVARKIVRYDDHDRVYFRVKGADGSLIAGDDDMPEPPATLKSSGQPIFHDGRLRGADVRIASLYYKPEGIAAPQEVLVQVAETLVKRNILADEILTGLIVPQLALILLAALSVWLGVGRGLAPLQRVQQEIAQRSHRDLSPVAEDQAPQEVRPLVRSINELMQRLERALAAQRRFVADAAHQLRTPLAGLKTQTEYALRQSDPENIRHALSQLGTGAQRAIHLANQLLALARAEPDAVRPKDMPPVDLNALARGAAAEWVPTALKKNIDLGFEGPETPVVIGGDAFLLTEMMRNLIDNAIRYTGHGGEVTLRVAAEPEAELTIEDNGPGIPADEREQVFERFYRVLGSDSDGSGLGLAIVSEIVQAHGAQITLGEASGKSGVKLAVRFPRYPHAGAPGAP
jgi:two-component system sensor histidine kinase TctE